MKTLREQLGKPVLFHVVFYHGKDGTTPTGYMSNDTDVIGDQLTAMQALGGPGCGIVALTYGPTVSEFIHTAVMEACQQCSQRRMPFALCFDPWTCSKNGVKFTDAQQADRDAAMIANLQHPDTQWMLNTRSYLPGKPVLDFNTGCDPKVVKAAVPGIEYWMNGVDYDWPYFPQQQNNTPLPCAYLEFMDGTGPNRNMSVWDQTKPARIIPSQSGRVFWSRNVSAGKYVQFVTFNDVAEGTDIEKFASMLTGRI